LTIERDSIIRVSNQESRFYGFEGKVLYVGIGEGEPEQAVIDFGGNIPSHLRNTYFLGRDVKIDNNIGIVNVGCLETIPEMSLEGKVGFLFGGIQNRIEDRVIAMADGCCTVQDCTEPGTNETWTNIHGTLVRFMTCSNHHSKFHGFWSDGPFFKDEVLTRSGV